MVFRHIVKPDLALVGRTGRKWNSKIWITSLVEINVILGVNFRKLRLWIDIVFCKGSRICVWHYNTMLFLSFKCWKLFLDELIVLNLFSTSLTSCWQGILKVFINLLLVKLLLNTVNDRHNSLDVLIKQIPFLQTLIRNNIVLSIFFRSVLMYYDICSS